MTATRRPFPCIECGLPTNQRCLFCHRPIHRLAPDGSISLCIEDHYVMLHPPGEADPQQEV